MYTVNWSYAQMYIYFIYRWLCWDLMLRFALVCVIGNGMDGVFLPCVKLMCYGTIKAIIEKA